MSSNMLAENSKKKVFKLRKVKPENTIEKDRTIPPHNFSPFTSTMSTLLKLAYNIIVVEAQAKTSTAKHKTQFSV